MREWNVFLQLYVADSWPGAQRRTRPPVTLPSLRRGCVRVIYVVLWARISSLPPLAMDNQIRLVWPTILVFVLAIQVQGCYLV